MFDTHQAAEALGITPRSLRRFMRNHDEFGRVGSGGRYVFSEDDIKAIRGIIVKRRTMDDPELAWLDQTPGFTMEQVSDPRMKRRVLEVRRERQRRLDARLQQLARDTVTVCS